MMGICYIVGAGEFYGSFERRDGDLIIAADGGYDTLKSLGITPDLLLGDMDSVSDRESTVESILFPVRKDETDSFLAYREGVKRGYTKFMLYGCVGGRDDHTFANYSLLIYGKERGHDLTIVGKECDISAIKNESVTVMRLPKKHLSLFAFGASARGVNISGAEYEAKDIMLTPEYPLGVSNRFTGAEVTVRVDDGILILMVER